MYGKEYLEWRERATHPEILYYLISAIDESKKEYIESGELTEYGRGIAEGMSITRGLVWYKFSEYVKNNLPAA